MGSGAEPSFLQFKLYDIVLLAADPAACLFPDGIPPRRRRACHPSQENSTMKITGALLIGGQDVEGREQTLHALNPATGETLAPGFKAGGMREVDAAADAAQAAFASYRETTPAQRAAFLEAIGEEIMALGDALIERALLETGLPRPRLEGERARTVNQLRLFAEVVRAGNWIDARIDSALPARQPLPRSDLRLRHIPVGPVVVFGASNFPLAFSVAGGDTASALAAGAPVIVKSHSAHLGTAELAGRAIRAAVQRCGLHEGVFSLIFGASHDFGQALVTHPKVKAVGFTGSRGGGLALMRAAASRPEPIPVYAEMSSINPVFLLPGALRADAAGIARGFVVSLVGSAGQLCTNPGLVIALDSPGLDAFIEAARAAVAATPAATMLTPGIHEAYRGGVARLQDDPRVQVLARGQSSEAPNQCQAALLATTAQAFLQAPHALGAEIFGAGSLVVRCRDEAEMLAMVDALEGQLTAALHLAEGQDEALAARLLPALELKAGRLLVNGFPTGVEVCHAMVHGGPFPATSDPRSTSVGSAAIRRFLRPVCYQDVPDALLPPALRADNPWGLRRLEDGRHVQG